MQDATTLKNTAKRFDTLALWGGIAFSLVFTALIWWAGSRLDSVSLLPDEGASWYYWKLPEPTFWSRATAWFFYLAHQISSWGLIYYSQKHIKRYSTSLYMVNIVALVMNAFFIGLHFVQTHIWYDGLAQDVSIWSSQVSVIIMLVWILLALLGLPASEEMPGRVLTEVMEGVEPPPRITTFETTPHQTNPTDRPELVISDGFVAHDAAVTAASQGSEVTLTSLFEREEMTATEHEVHDALYEGVRIDNGVMPIEVVLDGDGRAKALKMAKCEMVDGRPNAIEGTEYVIECDLIVSAIGQGGDLSEGLESLDNGRGLIDADAFYQVPGREGHFVAGDIIRPHLLTTAIGQASIASESIDHFLKQEEQAKRPKVDVHHFELLKKLNESNLAPEEFEADKEGDLRGTSNAKFAVHNYEDRASAEIIASDRLFLGHFPYTPRNKRSASGPSAEEVLGHFEERGIGLTTEQAVDEAGRCMSCGMCFECDNCVIYCPQDAIFRVKKDQYTTGRYVDTDYDKCIGCHICSDVCPTGYIDMAMGDH